jgi:glycine hydroxymethyltransferase
LVLAKLPDHVDSLELQNKLENCGIITNRNAVPNDDKSPWQPSGLRLGTAALTSRGLNAEQARELGTAIGSFIIGDLAEAEVSAYAKSLACNLNWYY